MQCVLSVARSPVAVVVPVGDDDDDHNICCHNERDAGGPAEDGRR